MRLPSCDSWLPHCQYRIRRAAIKILLVHDIVEIDAGENAEVLAAVTRLLSRSEMLNNPTAREAVKAEAQGLAEKGTWDLSTVTEREDLVNDAKRSGVKIHLGQLMSI